MDLGKNAIIVILVVAFLAVGAYVYTNTIAPGQKSQISVDGNSELTASPEFVSIYITIETTNKSADDAKTANSLISEKVMSALKNLNLKDEDIETISYNIYPDYDWNNGQQTLKGYKATNQLKVKLKEYNFAGTVIDKAVDAGAIISYINFEVSVQKENELKAQAIENATRDARNKAEAVARGSGGTIGRLISISTSNYNYMPYMAYDNRAMGASSAEMKSASTKISPQALTITANVQAVYELK
ncbi:MAG: SIMPL domain-containing protein [Candidatus Pacearchaeota archaeon]|jgi:hypothetical protein